MTLNASQKAIMRLLFVRGPMSNKTLAKHLGISNAGTTLTLRPLLECGMLNRVKKIVNGRVGRNEELIGINPSFGYFIGIDKRLRHYYVKLIDLVGTSLVDFSTGDIDELKAFLLDLKSKYPAILSVGVTVRGFYTADAYRKENPKFMEMLDEVGLHYDLANNVEALAYIHSLFKPEDQNFLLIKYGPGLGSSIFVGGKPVKRDNGVPSNIGQARLSDRRRFEDILRFSTLLGREYDELEGAPLILQNEEALQTIIKNLTVVFCDANAMLSLESIIFAGVVLNDKGVIERIKASLADFEPGFDLSMIKPYENYEALADAKAALYAFICFTL